MSTAFAWPGGPEVSTVSVQGATIRYGRYPNAGCQTLLLVHGGGANAAWWVATVGALSPFFNVLVVDLSGHGLSDHRENYSPGLWALELAAVLEAERAQDAVVVGHSMGGFVTVFLCAYESERVAQAVLIDSGLRSPGVAGDGPRGRERRRSNRVYETLEEALARFRLIPEQPVIRPDLLDVVARASLKEVDGGFTWRFDPQIFQRFTDAELEEALRQVRRPLALIYGEFSSGCGPETVAYIRRTSGTPLPTVAISNAYHHVPLDQPDLTAKALLELLEPRTEPRPDRQGRLARE